MSTSQTWSLEAATLCCGLRCWRRQRQQRTSSSTSKSRPRSDSSDVKRKSPLNWHRYRLFAKNSGEVEVQQEQKLSRDRHQQQQQQQPLHPENTPVVVSPSNFLAGATVSNAAMAAAGVVLGDWRGLDVSGQFLQSNLNLPAALAFILPLGGVCYYGVSSSERDAGFSELRRVFKESLIPQLQILPGWGLFLLALGAGVGEETLFRAFLQAAAIGGIQGAGMEEGAAVAAGIAANSLLFGALHALTPSYFAFAFFASALFGVEYLVFDLQTAIVTHWLYDWAALLYVLSQWGNGSGSDGRPAAS